MLLIVTIIGLCLVGCSAVPRARITDVGSFTVAQTLCENGGFRSETTINDMLGAAMSVHLEEEFPVLKNFNSKADSFVTHQSVWPAAEVLHNKKTTAKYDLSQGFGTLRCKDIIKLDVQQPNETILSVKCEIKYISFPIGYFLHWLNPFYERDHGRENMLMVSTTQRLQTDHHAQIEWLGKWRPDPGNP